MATQGLERTIVSRALASVFAIGAAVTLSAHANDMPIGATSSSNVQRDIMRAHFERFDANNDGAISRAEFDAQRRSSSAATGAAGERAAASRPIGRVSARELIGMGVRNHAGERLGDIEDLLIDVRSGKVRSAILSSGGFLEMGDDLFHYPLSSFRIGARSGELLLNVSEQSLKDARGFERDNWPDWVTSDKETGAAARRGVWQASRLLGRDIDDRHGDHLGEISDLVVNGRTGTVESAVMRYDRPWSLDNPLVAVPLDSLRFGDDRETVSMNVDRNQVDEQRLASGTGSSQPRLWIERWIVLTPASTSGSGTTAADTSAAQSTAASAITPASGRNTGGTGVAASTMTGADFDRLDTNKDGELSRAEYPSAEAAARPFGTVDRDGNNSISRAEFTSSGQQQLSSR